MKIPNDARSLRLQQATTLSSYAHTGKSPLVSFPSPGDVFWIVLWDDKVLKCMPGTYIGRDEKGQGLRVLVATSSDNGKSSVSVYIGVIGTNLFSNQEDALKQYKAICESTKNIPVCDTCSNAVKIPIDGDIIYSYCDYFYKLAGIPFPCGHLCPHYKNSNYKDFTLWDNKYCNKITDTQFTVPIPLYTKKGAFIVWVKSFYSNWNKGNLSHIPNDNIFFVEKISGRKITDGKYISGHTTITSYLGRYVTKKELLEKMNSMII